MSWPALPARPRPRKLLDQATLGRAVHLVAHELAGGLERELGDLAADLGHRPLLLGDDLLAGARRDLLGLGARIGQDLVPRVLGDLVGARDHLVRFLARLGHGRLALGSRELAVAGCRLGVLQPLADLLAALVEEREHPLEQESVQQVEEQQEVDDLEGELRQVDAERIEELHVGA